MAYLLSVPLDSQWKLTSVIVQSLSREREREATFYIATMKN